MAFKVLRVDFFWRTVGVPRNVWKAPAVFLPNLVGYSNSAQKTLESNAILCGKIFGGKYRSRECTNKGIYACLAAMKVVEISRRILVALQLLDLLKHKNNIMKYNK